MFVPRETSHGSKNKEDSKPRYLGMEIPTLGPQDSYCVSQKAQAKRGVRICRKMQRKQRNPFYLFRLFSFFSLNSSSKEQPTPKSEQFIKHQSNRKLAI
jgi:hypothetical protein